MPPTRGPDSCSIPSPTISGDRRIHGLDTNTQETKPAATAGGGLSSVLGILGAGLGVVALAAAIYLFVELRDARKQIGALQARVGEVAATADKRTKELDLGLAGLRGQTAAVPEKAGVTAAELE